MSKDVQVGGVAISKAGRDKGRVYCIIEVISEDYVNVADGGARKLLSPKKKKVKHLIIKPYKLESIAEKLVDGRKIFDAELKSAINALGEKQ